MARRRRQLPRRYRRNPFDPIPWAVVGLVAAGAYWLYQSLGGASSDAVSTESTGGSGGGVSW